MYFPRNVAVQLICLVLTLVVCVHGQGTKGGSTTVAQKSDCEAQKTCDKCISTAYCKWCSTTDDTSTKSSSEEKKRLPRCVVNTTPNKTWCLEDDIIDPPAKEHVTRNKNFSKILTEEVQLKPQSLSLKLRAGQEYKVKIDYKQAQGYPVDLYFLMDLSFSMETHRDKLSELGDKLATAMMSITDNFKLGFGSFVDKYILPMTSTQPEWLKNYCRLADNKTECATPYDFQHQMTLTSDFRAFKAQVAAAPISGNIDTPEGGLDALMQVMVCDGVIGWREKARHIIVYSSDATYHIAGDGRLAGLIEPNDEQCHLNINGSYDHAEILDYPSISQIKKIAQDKSKNIIFAVTENVKKEYKDLSAVIKPGLDATGVLQGDSSNVVEIVKKFTEELTSNIQMNARVPDEFTDMFKIDFTARPTGNSDGVKCEKNRCSGISEKTPIEFEVSITALKCPELEADRHQKIELELDGIPEKVVIDVDIICSCNCSRVFNSPKCTGNGDLACGVCECHQGYELGDCSCRVRDSEQGDSERCKAPNSTLTCSGHGLCNSCGVCSKCDDGPNKEAGDRYYGEFCECDNFLCPRTNYMPCGGPERGECQCHGICKCNPGYEGDACGCETEQSCIQPGGNGKPCNGFGECKCGKCQCKDNKRSGKYCELCTICVNEFCDKHKDCVECLAYQTGPRYTEDGKCSDCDDVHLEGKVDNLNETVPGTEHCMALDSTSCTFAFAYTQENEKGEHDKKLMVTAEKEKKCPPPAASPWTVAISAIALTLFLGLLGLVIWKILTMYHDHREWVKFEKERASAKWERGDNPLYKQATTTTKNPIYPDQTTE